MDTTMNTDRDLIAERWASFEAQRGEAPCDGWDDPDHVPRCPREGHEPGGVRMTTVDTTTPNLHETRARAFKAARIAATCRTHAIAADTLDTLDDTGRAALCGLARVREASEATWATVQGLLSAEPPRHRRDMPAGTFAALAYLADAFGVIPTVAAVADAYLSALGDRWPAPEYGHAGVDEAVHGLTHAIARNDPWVRHALLEPDGWTTHDGASQPVAWVAAASAAQAPRDPDELSDSELTHWRAVEEHVAALIEVVSARHSHAPQLSHPQRAEVRSPDAQGTSFPGSAA